MSAERPSEATVEGVEYRLLALFPMDKLGTGHIADCGYDANDERCDCSTLPQRISSVLAAHDAQVRADRDREWQDEWAVEVTWRDWQKAGAKGPTSQYGPFETEEARDRFLSAQRRDRDVAATRVLARRAAYTDWSGPVETTPTTEEEREVLLAALYETITGRALAPDVAGEGQEEGT